MIAINMPYDEHVVRDLCRRILANMPYDEPRRAEPRKDVVRDLCRRILALADENPVILKMSSAAILSIPELEFLDLNPTLAEVVMASEIAPMIWKSQHKDSEKP